MAEGDLTQVVKDLRQEETAFGLPQVPYSIVQVGVPSTDTSGADEWDLDTQYSSGMADQVKHLYIYDTTSLTDSDIGLEFNKWVSQDLAQGASASFGECEEFPYLDGLMVTNDEAMNEAAAQGQTMHASSGDTGASCAVAPTNGAPDSGPPMVNYPCSSPYIICVGGTTLYTNPDYSYQYAVQYNPALPAGAAGETAWVTTGGGFSANEYSPYWQSCVVPTNTTVAGDRDVPDIVDGRRRAGRCGRGRGRHVRGDRRDERVLPARPRRVGPPRVRTRQPARLCRPAAIRPLPQGLMHERARIRRPLRS